MVTQTSKHVTEQQDMEVHALKHTQGYELKEQYDLYLEGKNKAGEKRGAKNNLMKGRVTHSVITLLFQIAPILT